MGRAVIHVGYPKTATTTLQNRWFAPSHGDGLLEFFGKYTGDDLDRNFEPVPLREIVAGSDTLTERATLSANRVNVFSDERMTLPHLLKENSPYDDRENIDPFSVPERLRESTIGVDDVTILVTIRNQQSVINSTYAHYHYYLADHPTYGTWDGYLESVLSSERSTFDFDRVLAAYREQFDDIRVLLFEEFASERERFIEELADVLTVDPDRLRDSVIADAHENRKEKDDDKYVKRMGSDASIRLRNVLNSVYSAESAEALVGRLVGEQRKDRIKERWFLSEREIPRPSDRQRAAIRERFADGNERLSSEFGVEESKLRDHGYLPE